MKDVSDFKEVYEWLRENNPNLADFKKFHDCPSPILVEDENSLNEESEIGFPITVTQIPQILFLTPNQNLLITFPIWTWRN